MANTGPDISAAVSPVPELHVAVGVVLRHGRVLIARRPEHLHQGGLLEFPGGKVEPGESVRQALVRELAEETGLTVSVEDLEPLIGIRHDYGDRRVFLDVWCTDQSRGEACGREGQEVQWLAPEALRDEDFPAANRPIIRALRLPAELAITGHISAVQQGIAALQSALQRRTQPLIVLRAPALGPGDYRDFARAAVALCRDAGVQPLLHGSPEHFRSIPDAAGLHLPWREASRLRERPLPASAWLGVSCHDREQLAHAAVLGADYVTLGPVCPTPSHAGVPGRGWSWFAQLAADAVMPVYALGGVGPSDYRRTREAGGQGIAGIRFWWDSCG